MENQIFLNRLVGRYLNNQASIEELEVFIHLLREGNLDEVINNQTGQSLNEWDGHVLFDKPEQVEQKKSKTPLHVLVWYFVRFKVLMLLKNISKWLLKIFRRPEK